ncbi:MAG: hypothetical protein ACLQRH_20845 [Acidimicrobiales bacterium]
MPDDWRCDLRHDAHDHHHNRFYDYYNKHHYNYGAKQQHYNDK